MKHEAVTEDELEARIARELDKSQAEGYSQLHELWAAGIAAYSGVPTGNLGKNTNMSRVILNLVRHGTDTIHTHLLEIYGDDKETVVMAPTSHQMVQVPVKLKTPEGQEQEQILPVSTTKMGQQVTGVVNHILHKKNNGYKIISNWLFDSLIYGTGFVGVAVEKKKKARNRTYTDISPIEFRMEMDKLEQIGYKCEIIKEKVVEETIETQDETGLNISMTDYTGSMYEIQCSKVMEEIVYENIPPEEIIVNEGIEEFNFDHTRTEFIARRRAMAKSDIEELAKSLDVKLTDEMFGSSYSASSWTAEHVKNARRLYNGEFSATFGNQYNQSGEENELYELSQVWIKADIDGDGIREVVMAYVIGRNLIYWEEWNAPCPISSYSPWPVNYTVWGLSTYQKGYSLMSAKSGVVRQLLDLGLLQNTPRYFGNPDVINERNFQTVKPGLIPVTKTFTKDSVVPVAAPTGSAHSMALLEYLDKESINEYGLDVTNGMINQSIQASGNDKDKTQMVLDNASAKIDRIAREFAETGLTDLLWNTYCLTVEHSDDMYVKEIVETVTPGVSYIAAEFDAMDYVLKDDFVATVGPGQGTKVSKLKDLSAVAKAQDALMAHPVHPIKIPTEKRLKVVQDQVKLINRDYSEYFPSPKEVQQQEQQQMQQKNQLMQLKLKSEGEEHQANVGKTHAETQEILSKIPENEMKTKTGYDEQERKDFATQVDAEATAYQLAEAAEGGEKPTPGGVNVKIGN